SVPRRKRVPSSAAIRLKRLRASSAGIVRRARREADQFGRYFRGKPTLKPPYCVSKIAGALTHTLGGLEVNTEMRVLKEMARRSRTSSPAAATAIKMGRLAGIAAAKLVKG